MQAHIQALRTAGPLSSLLQKLFQDWEGSTQRSAVLEVLDELSGNVHEDLVNMCLLFHATMGGRYSKAYRPIWCLFVPQTSARVTHPLQTRTRR